MVASIAGETRGALRQQRLRGPQLGGRSPADRRSNQPPVKIPNGLDTGVFSLAGGVLIETRQLVNLKRCV